jgi:hypothetical protein
MRLRWSVTALLTLRLKLQLAVQMLVLVRV